MTNLDSLKIQNLNSSNDQLFLPCNLSFFEHDNKKSLQNSPKFSFFYTSNDNQQIPAEMKQYEQEIPEIFLNLENISNVYDNNNNSIDQQINNINQASDSIQNNINYLNSQIDSDNEFYLPNTMNQQTDNNNLNSSIQVSILQQNSNPKAESNTKNNEENKVHQIQKYKPISKKNAKLYKNIHRYLSHQIINQMLSKNFREEILNLCSNYSVDFQSLRDYFYSKIENFNSLQKLSAHWTIENNNNSELNQFKKVFRIFSKWFLEEKATRYILNGRMKNKKIYLEYKNTVMNYFIEHPEKYLSNQIQ